MRPFPQKTWKDSPTRWQPVELLLASLFSTLLGGGCARVASTEASTPPPTSSQNLNVTISPATTTVLLGNPITFTATVTNSPDTTVVWSVNGVAGGSAQAGLITADGVYTAPYDLPAVTKIKVTATSHANSKKSASATVTVKSDIIVTLGPGPTPMELGSARLFHAGVGSEGHPDQTLAWSLSGPACPVACGSIDAGGIYTAPQILPAFPNVMLTARSVADPAKLASTAVIVTSNFSLQLSVPPSVAAATNATFVVTLTAIAGSNPSAVLSWSLAGAGCAGTACGTLTVLTTRSAGGNATAVSASYNAPELAPTPNAITVIVTPVADPLKAAQAQFTIFGGTGGQPGVSVTPIAATRALNHRVTLAAQVSGLGDSNVNWSVNGVAGGNAAIGLLCVVASNPCQQVTGTSASKVDYVAPSAVPVPDPVTVLVASAVDPSKSATSLITVINHVVVSVTPGSVVLAPKQVQAFTATVLGADNQNVIWKIQGAGCTVATNCGVVTQQGAYTAPGAAPKPNGLQVVAVSSDDVSQSGAANVTISTGINITTLHPASVYAGAADGFTLKVLGSGFADSTQKPGSTLLIGGTARTTTSCATTRECIAPVTSADVAVAGSVGVQLQNPDGSTSNVVVLVVAPPNASDEVIALSAGAPAATGKDIAVVEPTTAGVSVPGNDVDLNVAALGIFSVANNSCTLGGNPVTLTRPPSGVASADVCLFSQSGLDTSMSFSVSGPGDVAVIAKQPVGLGIVRLTLQLPASADPSARSLLIQNTNLDKTAASGALWLR